MPASFLDHALAARVEAAHGHASAEYAETLARRRPDTGATSARLAGGLAGYAGAGSPLSQAAGVGMGGAVDLGEFDRLTAFFHSRGAPSKVEACPLADPSLWRWLGERGYRACEFDNVMIRTLDDPDDRPMPAGVEARPSTAAESGLVGSIVASGFFGDGELPPGLGDIFETMADQPSSTSFLGLVDGAPAAAGVVVVHDGVASLAGAATLPRYRNRGAQAALLRTRLAFAASLGCDLAVVCAAPGSGSMRNALRRGFAVAYTRVSMQLPIS